CTPGRVLYVQSRSSCSRSPYALKRRRFAANSVWSSLRFDPRTVFQRRRSNQRFPRPVLAHHRAGSEELLAADVVECGAGMLKDVELIEDSFGSGQRLADRVEIRPM